MDNLTEDFQNSLFTNSQELTSDLLEVGIDSLLKDGIIRDIPIVNTITTMLKIGKNVHDRNLLLQSLTFINEFNSNTIDEEKLEEYKSIIINNPKKREEELGRIILLLNNFIDQEKSIYLAKIFKSYIERYISWEEFCEYSEIINRIFLQDIEILKKFKDKDVNISNNRAESFRIERLYSLGLIGIRQKTPTFRELKDGELNMIRCISPLGLKFCMILFSDGI